MTKLFLAAGVAALAIAAPTAAKPGGGGGDNKGGGKPAQVHHGGGGGGGGGAKMHAPARGGGGGGAKMQGHRGGGGGFAAPKPQRVQRHAMQVQRVERRQAQRIERQQVRVDRQQVRGGGKSFERAQARAIQRQERRVERQVARGNDVKRQERLAQREMRVDRVAKAREQMAIRGNGAERIASIRNAQTVFPTYSKSQGKGFIEGCPPGLWAKNNGCMPPGQAKKYIGQPLNTLAQVASLSALPPAISYLYPDTDDYYYRYGDGYLYQVNRQNDLVSALLPLIAGGLLPGQMFPTSYAPTYVPSYFDAFYQDTPYVDYRYANGNVYGIDPYTGMIQDVVPLYAQGYGVGSALPSAYNYYNVPLQYRDMYYNTADTNYWYAPGAIYQVDPQTQLITSVAALLAPGLTVGQQLPAGYGVYNVPYDYRQTYYDTPNAWYRYNNGNIYQVDPTTQLVTAIVASLLT